MPCDRISVMQAQMRRQEAQRDKVLDLLRGFDVQSEEENEGTIMIQATIGGLPVSVAIEANGQITAGTEGGTFEQGVEVLEALVVRALEGQGVTLDDVSFEAHQHDPIDPWLEHNLPEQAL